MADPAQHEQRFPLVRLRRSGWSRLVFVGWNRVDGRVRQWSIGLGRWGRTWPM